VKASPLARRIARERGIDLGGLAGSGPGGRIVKADVQASLQGSARGPAPSQEAAPGATAAGTPSTTSAGTPGAEAPGGLAAQLASAKGETTEVELSRTQQTIARRMAESKATIPHFALEVEVDMEECVALRAELKRVTGAGETIPTYNDMVVKACALALRAHPRANSSYRDGRVQLHSRVNVGVAVATEGQGPQGGTLIVPTVFDAERKALGEIAREAHALAARVRDGSITPPELSGGTFTVSNLGMFGVRSFTAIINPPQAAILSVGMVRAMPVARDRGILLRHTMSLTLACDHRILYGADAARFLGHIRDLLERPAALTL
jgi:pyruvate dehydrogenase E2 component (dihydrolipoamide acetyltransferase)